MDALPEARPQLANGTGKSSQHSIPILMYHNVAARPRGVSHPGLYLTPAQFRRHLQLLCWRGYRGVSIAEGLPFLRGEKHGKVAILSFDDGYLDNLRNALPILLEFGFSASCYLVSSAIGSHNRWDSALLGIEKPLMNAAEIRDWLAAGMHVGSHSVSHPRLTRLSSAEKRRELFDSRAQLEDLLGIAIDHFCYPFGDHDAECRRLATECGYLSALTTRRAVAAPGSDLLTLPRLGNSGRKSSLIFLARTLAWR